MRTIGVPLRLINLQDDGYHLLVEIVLFKEKLLAVLDTGASRSVFDKSFLAKYLPDLHHSEETQATTLFTTSSTIQVTIPKLKIGRLTISDYPAIALDLDSVNQTYAYLGHPSIAGIVGSDILQEYQATINFKKLKVYLYRQ